MDMYATVYISVDDAHPTSFLHSDNPQHFDRSTPSLSVNWHVDVMYVIIGEPIDGATDVLWEVASIAWSEARGYLHGSMARRCIRV